ncbi:MAG: hypothetical protein ACXWPI_18085, partial [Ktedonobacterales bacterium]
MAIQTPPPQTSMAAPPRQHHPIAAFLTAAFGTAIRSSLRAPSTPEQQVRRRITLRVLLQAGVLWLVTRLVYAAVTLTALIFGGGESLTSHIEPRDLVHAWAQFDATFYLRIAAEGYTRANKVDDSFLPLYPLLIHGGTLLLGQQHAVLVALIVANAALLVAFLGLALLAQHDAHTSPRAAPYTLLTLSAYPLAFFLSAPWTDGLFLCFATWTLYGARTQRWRLAATCTFLAILTRISGFALVPPLAIGYFLAQWPRMETLHPSLLEQPPAARRAQRLISMWRVLAARIYGLLYNCLSTWRRTLTTIWVLEAPVLAVLLLLAMYWLVAGDALAYLNRQHAEFGHVSLPLWQTVALLWRQISATTPLSYRIERVLVDAIPLALVTLFLVCFAVPWQIPLRRRWRERLMGVRWLTWLTRLGAVRPLPLVYTLYLAAIVAMCVTQPVVNVQFPNVVLGSGRYITAAVPLWLALGRWIERLPGLQALLLGGGWALQALLL